MDYNSTRSPLVMPEYGRHIHKMVEHAKGLESREERTRCAHAIVSVMGNLFPHLRDVSDFKHKLWDHLAIMSDFSLDIDYPYEIPQASNFTSRPETVPYNDYHMRFKHYGRLIEQMIAKAVVMEEGELKNHLIALIAYHMRKSLFNWNRDNATDERVLNDLRMLSKGALEPTMEQVQAIELKEANLPQPVHQGNNAAGNQSHGNNRQRRKFYTRKDGNNWNRKG